MNQDAINYAKEQAELVKKQQQYQLEQAKLAEAERLNALNIAKQQANEKIALQKVKEEENAKSLQKNEYLSKLMNTKAINEDLIRNRLNPTGARETTMSEMYGNYGANINKINLDKMSALRDLVQSEKDNEYNYGQNASNVVSEEAIRRAQIQAGIDENALNQYNSAYSQYVAQKQYEDALKQQAYENEQNRLAQEEAIRQYNEQQAENVRQFNLQHALNKKTASNSSVDFTNSEEKKYNPGNDEQTTSLDDYYFTSASGEKYQPRYVNNTRLTQATNNNKKLVAGDVFANFEYPGRKIWTENGNYYVWAGKGDNTGQYADITKEVNSSLAKKATITLK